MLAAHPHTSLSLPAVRAISFNPILFQQVPPLDTVGTKLVTFIDEYPESDYPDSTPRLVLKQSITDSLIPHLKSTQPGKDASSPSPKHTAIPTSLLNTATQTTKILFGILPPTSLFPLVDLWRLLVLQNSVSSWALAQLSQPASILELVLDRAVALFADRQSKPLPKGFILTTLRFLCNLFCNPTSRLLISSPDWRNKLTTLMVSALLSEDMGVRTAAASLAFNVSAVIQRQRVDGGNVDVGVDAEWEIELVSVVLEAIDREEGSEEVGEYLPVSFSLSFSRADSCACVVQSTDSSPPSPSSSGSHPFTKRSSPRY